MGFDAAGSIQDHADGAGGGYGGEGCVADALFGDILAQRVPILQLGFTAQVSGRIDGTREVGKTAFFLGQFDRTLLGFEIDEFHQFVSQVHRLVAGVGDI